MQNAAKAKVLQFRKPKSWSRAPLNHGKQGSVYSRNGKLWVYFRYMNETVREPVGLADTPDNQTLVRTQLDLVMAEIKNGVFEYAKRFPYSTKKDYYTRLEGRVVKKEPFEVIYGQYYEKWFENMKSGMTANQRRDYESLSRCHILPFFGDLAFSEFNTVLMKRFVAHLKNKEGRMGKKLSGKTIRNIINPLRVVTYDAIDEYQFDMPDPFAKINLPEVRKYFVNPFSLDEWRILMDHMPSWYVPYFEFAVATGLRPSEQIAMKKAAIYDDHFNVELSRVRNMEKTDLKTPSSHRQIHFSQLPHAREILTRQLEMASHVKSDYVFTDETGSPFTTDHLRYVVWNRAIEKSGLSKRRMYETRHTFASWALAAGESPEWVARILGHVDTQMVFKVYSRWIPDLLNRDGSLFASCFQKEKHLEQ